MRPSAAARTLPDMADSGYSKHRNDRAWVHAAIAALEAESARSADTHLLHVRFPGYPGIDIYF